MKPGDTYVNINNPNLKVMITNIRFSFSDPSNPRIEFREMNGGMSVAYLDLKTFNQSYQPILASATKIPQKGDKYRARHDYTKTLKVVSIDSNPGNNLDPFISYNYDNDLPGSMPYIASLSIFLSAFEEIPSTAQTSQTSIKVTMPNGNEVKVGNGYRAIVNQLLACEVIAIHPTTIEWEVITSGGSSLSVGTVRVEFHNSFVREWEEIPKIVIPGYFGGGINGNLNGVGNPSQGQSLSDVMIKMGQQKSGSMVNTLSKPKQLCECGAHTLGHKDFTRSHSSWCPAYKGD